MNNSKNAEASRVVGTSRSASADQANTRLTGGTHTKSQRMSELLKLHRGIEKELSGARKRLLFLGCGGAQGVDRLAMDFAAACVSALGKSVVYVGTAGTLAVRARVDGGQGTVGSTAGGAVAGLAPVSGYPFFASSLPELKEGGQSKSVYRTALDDFFGNVVPDVDWVIVGLSSADLAVTDASSIFGCIDGIVLVTEADRTMCQDALEAKDNILNAGGKLLGMAVVNQTQYVPAWLDRLLDWVG